MEHWVTYPAPLSPWYDHNGWLGVKHQVPYLFTLPHPSKPLTPLQFTSRWHLCAWENPYVLHQVFPWCHFWNSSNTGLNNDSPFSLFKEDHHVLLLFMSLSSRQLMVWCPWSAPTGNVSSSSTLQIFWGASHLWWLLYMPVYLLVHFPS